MEEIIVIPTSISQFKMGTEFQVLDPFNNKWGHTKVVSQLCYSVKQDFIRLMLDNRIRIILK